jgi:hypothetical protein
MRHAALAASFVLLLSVGVHAHDHAPPPTITTQPSPDPDPVPFSTAGNSVDYAAVGDPRSEYSDPDMAITAGGEVCLVFLGFDDRADHVLATTLRAGEWQPATAISAAPGVYFPPRIATDKEGGTWVVWSARIDSGYEIRLSGYEGERWLAPELVMSDSAPKSNAVITVTPDRSVWIAWEEFRDGGWNIVARRRDRTGVWGEKLQVTSSPTSDSTPALGCDETGQVHLAWMSWRDGTYRDGNYEIYATILEPLRVEEPVRVSTSSAVDMEPTMLLSATGLELYWSESYLRPKSIGPIAAIAYDTWFDRVFQRSVFKDGRWSAPAVTRLTFNNWGKPFVGDQVTPLRPQNRDELWLFHSYMPERGWTDTFWQLRVCRVGPDGITIPLDLSGNGIGSGGRRVAAVEHGGKIIVAEGATHRMRARPKERPWSWIQLRTIDPAALPAPVPMPSLTAVARLPIPANLPVEPAGGERVRRRHGGHEWTAYFGNLHLHSDHSRDGRPSEGSPSQNYRVVMDLPRLDFAALSDHAEWITPLEWWTLRKTTELWNLPGRFVTIPGYEWTSSVYGHKNVFFATDAEAGSEQPISSFGMTPNELWKQLGERSAITIPHHVSHGISQPTNWEFRNDHFQRLVEIFQQRGNYEFDGAPLQQKELRNPVTGANRYIDGHSVRHALNMGHRMGIIASPDHGGGLGLAGVWATSLTRDAVFEAMLARRTFGTTAPKMVLYLEVAGHPLGTIAPRPAGPIELAASVRGTGHGLTLAVIRNGEQIQEHKFDGSTIEWTGRDDAPPKGELYYYLRVTQEDGHIGWTSPVWLEAGGSSAVPAP